MKVTATNDDIFKQALTRIYQLEETILKQGLALDTTLDENAKLKIEIDRLKKKEGEINVDKSNDAAHRQK